jgi:hypothetical protein
MEHPEQHEDAPPANNRAVKLPPFWTANLRAWFTSAEGAFRLRNIADEEQPAPDQLLLPLSGQPRRRRT